MTEVTEAHLQKACDLLNAEYGGSGWMLPDDGQHHTVQAFAKYIAEQETAAKHPPELVERMEDLVRKMAPRLGKGPNAMSGRHRCRTGRIEGRSAGGRV